MALEAAAGGAAWPMGLLSASSSVLGASSRPSGPSSADSIFGTDLAFDNSGWNVSFGEGGISSASHKSTDQGAAADAGSGQAKDPYIQYAVLLVAALIGWKLLQR